MTDFASTPQRVVAWSPAPSRAQVAGTVLIGAILPLALAAANGGYFSTSWGWGALVAAWIAALALTARPILGGREVAFIGTVAGFAAWIGLSWAWAPHAPQPWLEGLRALVLPTSVTAFLLVVRRVGSASGGVLFATGGISCYALATRLFPDRIGSFDSVAAYRLSTPIGYWNALGLFAAIGLLVAVGVASRQRSWQRALAGAVVPVLSLTIYFTFSRGSWIALAIGIFVAVAIDPRRLQLLVALAVLAPAAALGIWLASRSDALTHQQARLAQAARDGHRLAAVVVGLMVADALIAAALRRVHVPLRYETQRRLNLALAACAVLALAGGVAAAGGPVRLVERTHDAFTAPPPKVQGNLNQRLFSFSGNGRARLWRAAWDDYKAHPLLGSGAGSYEQYWLQHRKEALKVRDAHSLYLETLAELGPVGLLLLVVALAIPVTLLPRARHDSLVPALAGAYFAFLVHAAVDWDWEVLAVTLTGLFCGAGILIAARSGEEQPLSQRWRVGGIVAVLVVMAVAFVGLVGNIELSRAGTAARAGHWQTAARDARRAHTWAPWSSEPWQQLGEAQLGLGDQPAAQASFRKAIAKSPKDWSLWFDLARASTGKAQVSALAQAHRLNPLSPEIAEFEKELATQGSIGVAGN